MSGELLRVFWSFANLVLWVTMLVLILTGCATLGIGNPSPEQAALEGVAGIMITEYTTNLEDQDLEPLALAQALIAKGDDYLAKVYPNSGWTVTSLLEQFINRISAGKVNPQVGQMWYYVQVALDE